MGRGRYFYRNASLFYQLPFYQGHSNGITCHSCITFPKHLSLKKLLKALVKSFEDKRGEIM